MNQLNKYTISPDSSFYEEYTILFDYFNTKIGRTKEDQEIIQSRSPRRIRKTKPFDVMYLPSQNGSTRHNKTRKVRRNT